jgi:CIC family chloride channel protein
MLSDRATDTRQVSMVVLSLLSIVVGIVAGIGAVLLRWIISLVHNLFFLGELSLVYDANIPTPPSPFGPFVILAPVIGGLIVMFLVRRWAPEAKGHGVPEVMDAIWYKGGRIRPAVVVIKSLASGISIGSGASVGREGPIIQIGAGMGSVLGQWFHLRTWQILTLVAAGAGAGIAATFNTPLGAVLFAVELMLPEFSARTLVPVVLATGTATYMGRLAFGMAPAFLVAPYARPENLVPLSLDMLPLYVIFGLIGGLAALLFVRVLYRTEDLFDDWKANPYLKNVIAMTSLGVLFYVLMLTTGAYHTAGVGYDTIEGVLTGQISGLGFLVLLFLLKLAATSVSLAGGASGGVFSPSLFMGATLGGAFGAALNLLFPFLGFTPVTFALIGMAVMVGGSTGAALTSIMMLFEMTGDYSITVAAIIAVVCAVGVRTGLSPQDIYTTKLVRRGHFIPRDRRSHMFPLRHASDVMEPVVGAFERAAFQPPDALTDLGQEGRHFSLLVNGRSIRGVVPVDPENPSRALGRVIAPLGVVYDQTFLQDVLEHMADRGQAAVLVVPKGRSVRPDTVRGVITRDAIAAWVMRDFRS